MAVVAGTTALASEFNTLRVGVNKWFADNYPSAVFGDGNQTYGWGGSAAAAVSQGQEMTAVQMNTLVDRCNIGVNATTVVGSLSQIVAGNPILASEYNTIETKSLAIDAGRLIPDPAELSITLGGTSVKAGSWGSAAINCTFRYTLASFALQRYFWNSGGTINISGIISGYSSGMGWDGAGFNEIFTNMGTINMNYTATTQSGSGGTPTAIGYYDLTGVYQQIFQQVGSGAYTDAVLQINARYGSSGAYVEIQVVLTPGAGRNVDGTTTITTQYRKLNDQSSGLGSLTITAPTYSLIDPL